MNGVLACDSWGLQPGVAVYLNRHKAVTHSHMEKHPVAVTDLLALTQQKRSCTTFFLSFSSCFFPRCPVSFVFRVVTWLQRVDWPQYATTDTYRICPWHAYWHRIQGLTQQVCCCCSGCPQCLECFFLCSSFEELARTRKSRKCFSTESTELCEHKPSLYKKCAWSNFTVPAHTKSFLYGKTYLAQASSSFIICLHICVPTLFFSFHLCFGSFSCGYVLLC